MKTAGFHFKRKDHLQGIVTPMFWNLHNITICNNRISCCDVDHNTDMSNTGERTQLIPPGCSSGTQPANLPHPLVVYPTGQIPPASASGPQPVTMYVQPSTGQYMVSLECTISYKSFQMNISHQ